MLSGRAFTLCNSAVFGGFLVYIYPLTGTNYGAYSKGVPVLFHQVGVKK